MYKLSVPINISTLNEKSLPKYLQDFRRANVERIFLIENTPIYLENNPLFLGTSRLGEFISFFKEQGFEVGVWLCAFGHGNLFSNGNTRKCFAPLTKIKGVDGKVTDEGFCPLDENLQVRFCEALKIVASMHPDIIMLDDDFRLNNRSYNMGCCCEGHLKRFYDEVGEEIAVNDLEKTVFTGGANRYRRAWLKVQGESLVNFAKMLRASVDEVDETIRLGACAVYSTWDFDGTDMIELSRAFAGKTHPFMRTIGAPYHRIRPQYVVEHTRMQSDWCKGENIEIFAEGDTFPRPRYACSSRLLELFDMALLSSGATDGILKYMFDFHFDVEYETGYNDRHVRNKWLREGIAGMFGNKEPVGVRVCEAMHKAANYDLPIEYKEGVATFVLNTYFSVAAKILSENAIPTVYGKSTGYPSIIFGENAKYVGEEELRYGAILDVVAAKILKERGFDTGILQSEPCSYAREFFPSANDGHSSIASVAKHKAECADGAIVDSVFMPGESPASYRYENEKGQRFYVLAVDMYRSDAENCSYFLSYYRQKGLTDAIYWLCNKPLPAICAKNPYLYIQSATGVDGSMAIALYNMNFDEIIDPVITLDKNYSEIRFLNCEGTLCENKVTLSGEIPPYSAAFFEVK